MSLRTIVCALLASQAFAASVKNARVSMDAGGAVEKFDAKTDTDAGVETAQRVLAEMEDWAKSGQRPQEPKIATIDRLAKELEDALVKTHASAQTQVNDNIKAIEKCNEDQEKSFTHISATVKVAVGKQRTAHAQCRDAEVDLFEDMQKKCKHLTEWLKQTTEDGPEEPKGAGDDEMVEYVEKMSAYWCKKGEAAEDKQKICEKGKEAHLTQKEKCDDKQRDFESGFCIWRTKLIDTCTIHDTCYTDARNAYDDHLHTTQMLVVKWKTEYTALKKILCYVNVWLSDGDVTTVDAGELETCQKLKPDCSRMDINPGDAPPPNECSLEEVKNHPGTDAFKTIEYQKWAKFVSEPNSCLDDTQSGFVVHSKDAAAKICQQECKAKKHCCNDWKVGSNQMISCAQACMIRALGTANSKCTGLCARKGNSGCSLTENGQRYSFCQRCKDLDNTCPHGVQSSKACEDGCAIDISIA